MTDIKGMSDDELRSKLQELLGQAPGPVTNITRSTLQRQLARLMEEEKEYSKGGQGVGNEYGESP